MWTQICGHMLEFTIILLAIGWVINHLWKKPLLIMYIPLITNV